MNPEEEIGAMLKAFRSTETTALQLAQALHRQLCIARDQGGTLQIDFSEEDILSLAIFDAANHVPVPRAYSHMESPTNAASQFQLDYGNAATYANYMLPDALSDGLTIESQQSWYDDGSDAKMTQYAPFDDDLALSEATFSLPQSDDQSADRHDLYTWTAWDAQSRNISSESSNSVGLRSATDDADTQILQNFNVLDQLTTKERDQRLMLDIPLSVPTSDFSRLCAYLKDSGRQLLARGVTLQNLGCMGPLRCELLFRDRTPHDAVDIPNWACEVT